MIQCNNCGVEITLDTENCPLCKTDLQTRKTDSITPQSHPNKYNPGYTPLSKKERIRIFWELITIFHFSALVVTLLIDIISNGKPSWSLYAITSITASYVYITLLTLAIKKLWIFLPGLFINTLGFLALIDLYHNGMNWFVNPGLPLTGFFVILLGMVLAFTYTAKQRGFNIIAAALLAAGLYCILSETFIELALGNPVSLSWSVIVAASILPFALLLFFFHYRLKKGTSLRKFFHL